MQLYWLWLACLQGISPRQKHLLIEHFRDPQNIYYGSRQQLEELGIAFSKLDRDLEAARTISEICENKNIGIITYTDSLYPSRLRTIADAPIVLYCRGRMPSLEQNPAIGIVGTRRASAYGLMMSQQFGAQIAACGGIVVSGGAIGVDSHALLGAVSQDRPTIAVMAGGVDKPYPKSNEWLFDRILERGCLLSEYPPGVGYQKWDFLQRNRIISGISNGVLVVQAPARSGALNTAKWAYEQSRDVFVVPGNLGDTSCEGTNQLLEDGAAAVTTGWGLLSHYEVLYPHTVRQAQSKAVVEQPQEPEQKKTKPAPTDKKVIDNREHSTYSVVETDLSQLTDKEQAVAKLLTPEPRPMDEVMEQSGLEPAEAIRILTKLSMEGVVKLHPGRRVSL